MGAFLGAGHRRDKTLKEDQFQQLIKRAESETLDFKEDGYDLQNSRGRNNFIKDLLAMADTPRIQPAHIIFGVRWTPESESVVVGPSPSRCHVFD